MSLSPTTTSECNKASKAFRQAIRAAVSQIDPIADVSIERGNAPVRLGVLKPWARTPASFKGADVGVPILIQSNAISFPVLGIQPVQQDGRGNAYQNALFRIAATASFYPIPIAVVIPDGDELSGINEPGYFFRWWKALASQSQNIKFVGTLSEFKDWLDLQLFIKSA